MSDTIEPITPIGPYRVMLRNRAEASITHRVPGPYPWRLMGALEKDGDPVLFTIGGRFAENLKSHPLDIVGIDSGNGFAPFIGLSSLT